MKHFSEKEFWCRCSQCQKGDAEMGIPPGGMIGGVPENVKALVENVLDPLREKYGKPIRVNSGYRCPKHNLAVGGASRSQHLLGEAADIAPVSSFRVQDPGYKDELARLVEIIKENGKWDQMIIYPTFVHVSWKRFGPNRKQTLRKVSNGYQKV
jgi:hypothetical protein